ncbi:MAG: hypothetical protein ACI9K2_006786 [Myxococcota bacterium]|jgi:hypothetical protein
MGVHGEHGPVLRRRVRLARPHVFSRSNDNSAWSLWVETEPIGASRALFLRHGDMVLPASSTGSGGGPSTATFDTDRVTAERLAGWLSIPASPRVPLGEGLVATFSRLGDTRIQLTLANIGPRVGVVAGGRQRGPRNNRFHFAVFRDGTRLPELDGWDFGGLSGVQVLEAGDSLTQDEDVSRWADLAAPATYEVRCSYQAELVPGDAFARWPETAHETWEPTYAGAVSIPV